MVKDKKKVLIFGVSGMAGHMIYHHMTTLDSYEVYGTSFRTPMDDNTILLDVSNFEEVKNLIDRIGPNIIINAVGVLIRGAKEDSANAILINGYFPHFLQILCRKQGCKLVHISTDCVFSGNIGQYVESSFRDADDIYGRSKALGEIENGTDVTIRTSIIGPELKETGEGLFHWFMSQAGQINGFDNMFWGGVTTLELAKNIDLIIEKDIVGIFHLTNSKKISKYELLKLFKEIWERKQVSINKIQSIAKDKSMVNTRIDEHVMEKSYEVMLIQLKEFMDSNNDFYGYGKRYN
ncbi:SDR family oxidoreductase [Flagellimonas sp. S3867]|uniref:dTDP-4-dehydrorhamnose reductase family protein n=1 Tax=Flagellimonas sp. S3867 TaxID=2768063 RepID=UPI001684FB7C|nr:SDR family oxidoreductase [Flagellimonas sp. S3867]